MIGQKMSVRAPSVASRGRLAPKPALRKPLSVRAAVKWYLQPDTPLGQDAPAKPAIELTKLWSEFPHRVVLSSPGTSKVVIATSTSTIDPTLASFNYHGAATISDRITVVPDYHHESAAHATLVIEGDDRDNSATVALQRGDRSSMQVKLNGRLLKVEKKTPLKPGDLISLPDIEYRIKAE